MESVTTAAAAFRHPLGCECGACCAIRGDGPKGRAITSDPTTRALTAACQASFADCRCEPCTDLRELYDATVVQTGPEIPRAADWESKIARAQGRIIDPDELTRFSRPERTARAATLARQTDGEHARLMARGTTTSRHGGMLGLLQALRRSQ